VPGLKKEEPCLSRVPSSSRGDSRRTFLNETAEQRLIRLILPQRIEFAADAITRLVTPGLYANTRALRTARRRG